MYTVMRHSSIVSSFLRSLRPHAQLLPEPEAQAQFTRWLQQSASEQQLIDRVEKQRAALASAASANQAKVPPGFGALGGAVGGAGGGAGGAAPCLDPLGLNNNLNLASTEQLRPKSAMPGAQAGGGKGGPLLGAKDRMFLLQRLQQAALGGGGSSAQGQGAGAGASAAKRSGGGKYTRNKARALKSASAGSAAGAAGTSGGGGGGGMAASASIVPQDEAFDPVLFLTIIHGGSSFDDLRRGQENLEKGLGTQAGQLQRLVLEHYDAFGRCAEGIQWFRHMVEEEFFREAANGHGRGDGAKIAHLLEIVAGTQAGAKELFRPLLERMDRAKGLRSARLLLQRLARVLDVPGRMAQLEALGKYEEVVREYERVRALPSGAGAGLLGRVQLQAEAVADKLRARLRAYVGADAHPVEDLVQAADLLVRLGPGQGLGQGGLGQGGGGQEEDEPLLFTFARQAELLGKGLDALEAWYAKELQAVKEQEQREGVRRQLLLQQQATKQQTSAPLIASASGAPAARVGWKQRSFHSIGDGDAMDEEEGDEEEGHGGSSAAGGAPMRGRSRSHGTGDGEEEEDGENDEDSLEDDSLAAAALGTGPGSNDDDDDLLLVGSPMGGSSSVANHRRGGLNFSMGFGLDSVEHRASALRLQYTRRLVRLGLRSLPTLLHLAALVADDLADVRVTWEPGHFTFHVTNASAGGRDRSGSRLVTGGGGGLGLGLGGQEVTAASAALDQVGLALQRISKAARRAMFGESGARAQPPRSPKHQQAAAANAAAESVRHRPLDPVYFREALRAVAELYFEGVREGKGREEERIKQARGEK